MSGSAITGSGLQRYRTGAQVLAVGLNVGLNVWLIPRHGWLGAAWSSLATDGTLAIVNCAMLVVMYRFAEHAVTSQGTRLPSAEPQLSDSVAVQSTESVHGRARISSAS